MPIGSKQVFGNHLGAKTLFYICQTPFSLAIFIDSGKEMGTNSAFVTGWQSQSVQRQNLKLVLCQDVRYV